MCLSHLIDTVRPCLIHTCHAMPMPCSDHAVLLKATAQHGRLSTAVLCSKLQREVRCCSQQQCQKFRRKKFHSLHLCIWKWVLGLKGTFYITDIFIPQLSRLSLCHLLTKQKRPTLSPNPFRWDHSTTQGALVKQNVIDTFRYVLLWSMCWQSG